MKKVLKFIGLCSFALVQNLCIAANEDDDKRTLEELEQCPCVQKYVLEKYGEDLTKTRTQKNTRKKKKKNRKL